MAPFAGFDMPISYRGIREEHFAVRQTAGLFDVSHMGEFIVRGKEALDLVNFVTSNDAAVLKPGDVQYSCLPGSQGGIVDDLLVYRLGEEQCASGEQAFMLVVNAANIQKDFHWIESQNRFDARLIDISAETALLALQGPAALSLLHELTAIDLGSLKYYTFSKGEVAGIGNVLVSATGYTGAGGFELYLNARDATKLWDALTVIGGNHGLLLTGLGCRDTLRVEMGYCLYGQDIDETTSPLEAGLGWITRLGKSDFIQRERLLAEKKEGISRVLTGFILEDRRVPRPGYHIIGESGEGIGQVTSGTMSPTLNQPIGMGYVPLGFSHPGSELWIEMGGKSFPARVVKPPFIPRN